MTVDDPSHADTAARPCAMGLMVGTLALMTAHAAPEPAPGMDGPTLQRLVARKIASNLFFLHHHPDAPDHLRQLAGQLHGSWAALALPDGVDAATQSLESARPPRGTSWH